MCGHSRMHLPLLERSAIDAVILVQKRPILLNLRLIHNQILQQARLQIILRINRTIYNWRHRLIGHQSSIIRSNGVGILAHLVSGDRVVAVGVYYFAGDHRTLPILSLYIRINMPIPIRSTPLRRLHSLRHQILTPTILQIHSKSSCRLPCATGNARLLVLFHCLDRFSMPMRIITNTGITVHLINKIADQRTRFGCAILKIQRTLRRRRLLLLRIAARPRPATRQQINLLQNLLQLNALFTRTFRIEQSRRAAMAIIIRIVIISLFAFLNSWPSQILIFIPLLRSFGLNSLLVFQKIVLFRALRPLGHFLIRYGFLATTGDFSLEAKGGLGHVFDVEGAQVVRCINRCISSFGL